MGSSWILCSSFQLLFFLFTEIAIFWKNFIGLVILVMGKILAKSNARIQYSQMNNDNCWSRKKRYCVDIVQCLIATWPSCFSINWHEKLKLININDCMQAVLGWRSYSYSCTFSGDVSREIYYIKGYSRCTFSIFILRYHSFISLCCVFKYSPLLLRNPLLARASTQTLNITK